MILSQNEIVKRLLRREERREGETWFRWQWRKFKMRVRRAWAA